MQPKFFWSGLLIIGALVAVLAVGLPANKQNIADAKAKSIITTTALVTLPKSTPNVNAPDFKAIPTQTASSATAASSTPAESEPSQAQLATSETAEATKVPTVVATPTPAPSPLELANQKYKPSPITVLPSNYQGRMQDQTFYSPILNRRLSFRIYLPPNYDSSNLQYPVLYMLHGLGGANREWMDYGLFDIADKMIRAGKLTPVIIVLPSGEQSYWFNAPNNGPRWSDYVAEDVVGVVDGLYRTIPDRQSRAIGGHSMGGHGALQIAFNHPNVFGIIGAHSPTLRNLAEGKDFNKDWGVSIWGDERHYAIINPMSIAEKLPTEVLQSFKISLDVGDKDTWLARLTDFHQWLSEKGVPHQWSIGKGEHGGEYWIENVPNYLSFYGEAFSNKT